MNFKTIPMPIARVRPAKTEGLVWLELSVNAFNGSGYANRTNAEAFMESYIDYKNWKHKPEAVKLANEYWHAILPLAEHLLPRVYETTRIAKKYNEFLAFRELISQQTSLF